MLVRPTRAMNAPVQHLWRILCQRRKASCGSDGAAQVSPDRPKATGAHEDDVTGELRSEDARKGVQMINNGDAGEVARWLPRWSCIIGVA